jgi:hypothetical protein
VFAAVRQARPAKLFLACDAPRSHRAGEAELVAEVRRILQQVDWPCEVKTRFLEQNLGCGRAVSSAIEWFLNDAKEGIILEDDCLPAPAFFEYTAAMLDKYRDDERIGIISGTNMAPEVFFKADYGFSKIITCWGWATWLRTWKNYRLIPDLIKRNEVWVKELGFKSLRNIENSFERIHAGDIHTWDYQLLVQQLRAGQLTVVPRYNLVLNIGFDGNGTHFNTAKKPWWAPRYMYNFKGNWLRPVLIENSKCFDSHYLNSSHGDGGKLLRLWIRVQRLVCSELQKQRKDRVRLG